MKELSVSLVDVKNGFAWSVARHTIQRAKVAGFGFADTVFRYVPNDPWPTVRNAAERIMLDATIGWFVGSIVPCRYCRQRGATRRRRGHGSKRRTWQCRWCGCSR